MRPGLGFIPIGRAATPNEAADALAVLYPALLRFAGKQLGTRHLSTRDREDIVQQAAESWFASSCEFTSSGEMNAWLRQRIAWDVAKLQRPHDDVLDNDPLPLDEQIEEE